MARVWQGGAELQSVTLGVEISGVGTAAPTINTIAPGIRSGAASWKCTCTTSNTGFNYAFSASDITAGLFARGYMYFQAYPTSIATTVTGANADVTIMQFLNSGGSWCEVTIDASGIVRLYSDATSRFLVGTSSTALALNTWHCIELATNGNTTTMELRIDGLSIGRTTAATGLGGSTTVAYGLALTTGESCSGTVYVDDCAVNTDTGTVQNSWCSEGRIIHLIPTAAGDNNAWATTSGGTAGSTFNYTRVNQVPPDDVTSYNATASANLIDDFKITTSAVITQSSFINVVAVGVRYAGVSTTANQPFTLRLKSQASGLLATSSAITPNATSYKTNANAAPINYPIFSYTDPQAGGKWTAGLISTTQIGYTSSGSASTNATRITDIWASIEYQDPIVKPKAGRQAVNRAGIY